MQAPPIHFKADFIESPAELFQWLQEVVVWDERMKSRKTASYGVAYNYSQITYPECPMPPELMAISDRIHLELGFRPNNCLMNDYPDGNSSMGFHSDSTEELAPGTGVAIVSVGGVRTMTFRSKSDKTVEVDYLLPSGSLLYMSDHVQREWLHAVPKCAQAGERISLTFRLIMK